MKRLVLSLALIAAGCANTQSGSTSTTSPLAATCDVPADTTLSTFNADGTFPVTGRGVSADGSMAVNLCDGPVFRVLFVEGMIAGDAAQHQGGLFTDGQNHLVHHDDLITTSTTPVAADGGLDGVKVTCFKGVNCKDAPDEPAPAAEDAVSNTPAAQAAEPQAATTVAPPPHP